MCLPAASGMMEREVKQTGERSIVQQKEEDRNNIDSEGDEDDTLKDLKEQVNGIVAVSSPRGPLC